MSKLKLPKEKLSTIPELFGCLLNSATQAHVFHLQTTSFAEHKALESFYEGIVPLTDILIETYQGKYGIVKDYSSYTMKNLGSSIDYLEVVQNKVEESKSLFKDSDILNILDEITALMKQTLYKLKHLK
jgi:hypothetical protein